MDFEVTDDLPLNITFGADKMSIPLSLTPLDDEIEEGFEYFTLELSLGVDETVRIVTGTAEVHIKDDDGKNNKSFSVFINCSFSLFYSQTYCMILLQMLCGALHTHSQTHTHTHTTISHTYSHTRTLTHLPHTYTHTTLTHSHSHTPTHTPTTHTRSQWW